MDHRVDKRRLGPFGESIAARFLTERGFEIVSRNVRIGRDELDLIVAGQGETIVVEVKCTADGTDPVSAVDDGKLMRLERAARSYQGTIDRIDLIAVRLGSGGAEVRWIRSLR